MVSEGLETAAKPVVGQAPLEGPPAYRISGLWLILARACSRRFEELPVCEGGLDVTGLTLKDDAEAAFTDFLSNSVVTPDN